VSPRHTASPSADAGNDNEVQALAEAVSEAASVAGLGVSVAALCGRPFEQLVQRDIGELVHADDRELLAPARRR
jgi:hypothetical protein